MITENESISSVRFDTRHPQPKPLNLAVLTFSSKYLLQKLQSLRYQTLSRAFGEKNNAEKPTAVSLFTRVSDLI